MLSGLDPEEAYEARVIAHNAKGTSAPGPPSQPLLIANTAEDGLPLDAAAPRAVAVGAAAVVVTWAPTQQAAAAVSGGGAAQSCRPRQRWEVLVQRYGSSTSMAAQRLKEKEREAAEAEETMGGPRRERRLAAAAAAEVDSGWVDAEWSTVASGVVGSTVVLPSMRCVKGCRFKVRVVLCLPCAVLCCAALTLPPPNRCTHRILPAGGSIQRPLPQ